MNFDKYELRLEIEHAKDCLIRDIKNDGFKAFFTTNTDVLEDLHDIEQAALLEAFTNPDTKHKALRKHLWSIIADSTLEEVSDQLRLVIDAEVKELEEYGE